MHFRLKLLVILLIPAQTLCVEKDYVKKREVMQASKWRKPQRLRNAYTREEISEYGALNPVKSPNLTAGVFRARSGSDSERRKLLTHSSTHTKQQKG